MRPANVELAGRFCLRATYGARHPSSGSSTEPLLALRMLMCGNVYRARFGAFLKFQTPGSYSFNSCLHT